MIPQKSFRRCSAVAICLWAVSAASSSAQSAQQKPGKILVADVAGKVEAVDPSNSVRTLKNKDSVAENNTVKVGDDSKTTLVFSNGSTVSLSENSSLVISQFIQSPFSTPFAMPVENEEPSTSTTALNLVNGEVICKVKKLRIDDGSSLTINTPVGAAGVRGTTFAVSYLPNQNGTDRGTFTLSVTEGVVALTDKDGNVTLVPAGQEVTVSFRSSVDPVTGEVTILEIIAENLGPIPAGRMDRINRVAAQGDVDSEFLVFNSTDENPLNILQLPNVPAGINNPNQNSNADLIRALQQSGDLDPDVVTDPNP